MEAVRRLINSSGNNNGRSGNTGGVVIFSKSSCCMCYTVKVLFHELGVNPIVHEIDQMNQEGNEIEKALKRLGCKTSVPAVFIGGILVGSTNEVMSLHLSGSLLPLIRPYRLHLQYPSGNGRPAA